MDNLSPRQKKILWIVVRTYIDSAEPVGSNNILSQHIDIDCSAATVRNELSALEELGYLTHPYTSAGRIPTDKGYRFYVDELMEAYRLTAREKALVDNLQQALNYDIQNIMEETMRTIHSISNQYTAIVKTDNNLLAEITGKVSKHLEKSRRESLYLSGMSKMFYEPEFNNADNIRKVVNLFDEKERFMQLLDNYSDPQKVNVNIGHELKEDNLQDFSLVTRDFTYKGEPVGSIGVFGPTRMQYSKVTAAIDNIAKALDNLLESL